MKISEKFLIDPNGHKVGVVLNMKDYRKLLKNLEELDAIRAYDSAKISRDVAIPFDQAIKEIEQKRKWRIRFLFCAALRKN